MRIRRALLAGLLLLPACGGPRAGGELRVFAASSLTESFTDLAHQLETRNTALKVTLSFAASSALLQQVRGGEHPDVFASADEATMQKLVDGSLVFKPETFAHNRLAIVVGEGNPKAVRSLADLAKPGLIVVLCGSQVPCGKSADQAMQGAGVRVKAASREENVKAVLTKVSLGEADAGIVYVTDVKAGAGKVEGVEIPEEQSVLVAYPIAILQSTRNPDAARAFVSLVRSAAGQRTLRRYGFLA